jgi:type IV pilus assembly protein PilW
MLNLRAPRSPGRQRGLSLVEMMVGIAVGLIVVAGAGALVANQLGDNRRLLLEAQVQQDLRAAMDIVTRDLRRAGGWTDTARLAVWAPGAPAQANPYTALAPASAAATQVDYNYYRNAGSPTAYGFRLQGGVLQTLLGGWQDLTDARAVRITAFSVTPRSAPAAPVPCPRVCPGGGSACWTSVNVNVRELVVDITGQAVSDPAVQRSLSTSVRLRNDEVEGACP